MGCVKTEEVELGAHAKFHFMENSYGGRKKKNLAHANWGPRYWVCTHARPSALPPIVMSKQFRAQCLQNQKKKFKHPIGGQEGLPDFLGGLESLYFCEFHHPRTAPSRRIVTVGEEKEYLQKWWPTKFLVYLFSFFKSCLTVTKLWI